MIYTISWHHKNNTVNYEGNISQTYNRIVEKDFLGARLKELTKICVTIGDTNSSERRRQNGKQNYFSWNIN